MTLTDGQLRVLRLRSEKNKIGVPVNRELVSAQQRLDLAETLQAGLLTWIDQEHRPDFGFAVDVYLLTPAGIVAIEEAKEV